MKRKSKATARREDVLRRKGVKHSKDPKPDHSDQRRVGDETTHYEPKKQRLAIAVRRCAKTGWPRRKIAKDLGLTLDEVNEILDR